MPAFRPVRAFMNETPERPRCETDGDVLRGGNGLWPGQGADLLQ